MLAFKLKNCIGLKVGAVLIFLSGDKKSTIGPKLGAVFMLESEAISQPSGLSCPLPFWSMRGRVLTGAVNFWLKIPRTVSIAKFTLKV